MERNDGYIEVELQGVVAMDRTKYKDATFKDLNGNPIPYRQYKKLIKGLGELSRNEVEQLAMNWIRAKEESITISVDAILKNNDLLNKFNY